MSDECIFSIETKLKAVLGQYGLFTDRNTRDHLTWTVGNGDPTRCASHT